MASIGAESVRWRALHSEGARQPASPLLLCFSNLGAIVPPHPPTLPRRINKLPHERNSLNEPYRIFDDLRSSRAAALRRSQRRIGERRQTSQRLHSPQWNLRSLSSENESQPYPAKQLEHSWQSQPLYRQARLQTCALVIGSLVRRLRLARRWRDGRSLQYHKHGAGSQARLLFRRFREERARLVEGQRVR